MIFFSHIILFIILFCLNLQKCRIFYFRFVRKILNFPTPIFFRTLKFLGTQNYLCTFVFNVGLALMKIALAFNFFSCFLDISDVFCDIFFNPRYPRPKNTSKCREIRRRKISRHMYTRKSKLPVKIHCCSPTFKTAYINSY